MDPCIHHKSSYQGVLFVIMKMSFVDIIAVNMNEIYDLNPEKQESKGNNRKWGYFVGGNLFVIAVAVYFLAFWNAGNLNTLNYPSDSYGNTCFLKYARIYPFLYIDFTTANIKYRCVSECPSSVNGYMTFDSRGALITAPKINQTVNAQLGGVCWSKEIQLLMIKRGLFNQIQSKQFLLNKFSEAFHLCLGTLVLSVICAVAVFCLPTSFVYFSSIVLAFGLIMALIVLVNTTGLFFYHIEMTVMLGILLVVLLINLYLFKDKMIESIRYSTQVKDKLQNGHQSSILKFIKCIRIPLAFTLFHTALLLLILIEYIGMVSNSSLVKLQNDIYNTPVTTWWKIALLLVQWLFLSTLFENIYKYLVVQSGYQIMRQTPISFTCPSFGDIINIYHLTFIQTLLWLPLKLIVLIKPEGAILYQNNQVTVRQGMSKTCYCCCGAAINYLHRFSVNPFLILTLQPSFDDLYTSLSAVQQTYHKKDPSYDKTSLWLYRLSNYINVAILSIGYVTFATNISNAFASSSFSNWFLVFGIIVTVQLSQYMLTLWSQITEVAEFYEIFSTYDWTHHEK